MGMSSPPQPIDPNAVASTQQQYNIQSQAGSLYGQQNPYGSLSWTQTGTGPGGVPQYTANVNLSPAQQQLLNQLNATKGIAGGIAANTMAGYAGQTPTQTIGGISSGLTKPIIQQYTSYMQPFFDTQTTQLDAKLRNQGLGPGSPGYDQAMNALRQSQGQSISGEIAQVAPGAEQLAMQMYGLPMGMASWGGPTSPTGMFQQGPALPQTNYVGAVSQYEDAQMKAYQAQQQQQSALMSGLFGIPTAILGGWARGGFGNPFGGGGVTATQAANWGGGFG